MPCVCLYESTCLLFCFCPSHIPTRILKLHQGRNLSFLFIIATTGLRTVLGKLKNGWMWLEVYVLTSAQSDKHSRGVWGRMTARNTWKTGSSENAIYNKLCKQLMGLVIRELRMLANQTWGELETLLVFFSLFR